MQHISLHLRICVLYAIVLMACAPDKAADSGHPETASLRNAADGKVRHAAGDHTDTRIAGVTIADDYPDYTSPECLQLCDSLYKDGVRWVALTPCGFMRGVDAEAVQWGRWSRRDYVGACRSIRKLGLKILLKPYIWSHDFWSEKKWTGDIQLTDSAAVRNWFASYEQFLLDNARFARQGGADMLCIALELPGMSHYEAEWRALIRAVRAEYTGPLLYAAHGIDEARRVRFWDALDYVGVNIYPTLSEKRRPRDADLRAGWQPLLADFDSLYTRLGKPIILTEAGFRSVEAAAYKPWEWPEHETRPVSMEQQEQAYRILAEQCYGKEWFGGIFWWKVFTTMQAGGPDDGSFTPQNKPAYRQMVHDFQRWAP